jgi:hypothetical protein
VTADSQPKLLILSFSPISTDARVLKQIELFRDRYEVTTCGYGPTPDGVAEHIRIPDGQKIGDLDGRLITLRLYRRAYWSLSAVRWVSEALRGRTWDTAIANDVEAAPLVSKIPLRHGFLCDLHEYSPRVHETNPAWMRRISPYVRWLCRRYVARASAWSTVSRGLADEYRREFGFAPAVVTNATPFRDTAPTPPHTPVALVHSGVCLRNRDLLTTIRGVQAASSGATLDLYLMPNDPGYLAELREAAAETPDRVRVLDPVPYDQLVSALEGYDLGIFVLPPNSFSHEHALPNKFFDFVQARLGIVVGPSPEMAAYVQRYSLGVVTDGFSAESIARAVDALTPGDVEAFKAASHAAASELSAQHQVEEWKRLVDRIVGAGETR